MCRKHGKRQGQETRDLTAMVREYSSSPEATRPYGRSPVTTRPRPKIQADMMDGEGNLHAADIGITWEGNETFLHGVKVVGPHFPRPAGPGLIMSSPYPQETRKTEVIRPRQLTAYTGGTCTSRRYGCPRPSTSSGSASGISTGLTYSKIQQQIPQLAGVVSSFPGGC